ncbi:MAG TPA: type II toxin-antitoxin system VapC family toxin [Candidatus Dormibacteraeota bacterium]|nr:type II toxin-antitoxin system VapC family toxin [Candidatus Dormibacteraeota bacterium]
MVCFDTNIIIYLGNGILNGDVIGNEPICYASVTLIESLGYPDILSAEEQRLKELFATMTEIPLSEPVLQTAIQLRQLKKMSLGDSIVAATALENGKVLWTVNTDDFRHIENLKLVNPLQA